MSDLTIGEKIWTLYNKKAIEVIVCGWVKTETCKCEIYDNKQPSSFVNQFQKTFVLAVKRHENKFHSGFEELEINIEDCFKTKEALLASI